MRFRRWPRPTAYRETSRKRAAFLRKQRLERAALPLFAAQIDARQHGIDEEMARRAIWWVDYERDRRDQRAASSQSGRRPRKERGCQDGSHLVDAGNIKNNKY